MKFVNPMPAMLLLLVGLLTTIPQGVESIGIAYGILGNNLPPPGYVVNMYKSYNIPRMRIYSSDPAILRALRGSNIELVMGFKHHLLRSLTNPNVARDWVYKYIISYPGVSFRYIVVGNELIPGRQGHYVLPVMQNIQAALNNAGLNQIKVTTSIAYNAITGFPPSAGTFKSSEMLPIVRYLKGIDSPLLVSIYPYFAYTSNKKKIRLDYALFTAPGTVVTDPYSNLKYQNLFDAMVDTVLWAMEKVSPNSTILPMQDKVMMSTLENTRRKPPSRVIVSETGWPHHGRPGGQGLLATLDGGDPESKDNARTYNQNLINHVKKGTPKRPCQEVETYIFSMFNENEKLGAEIERNFGLFYPNQHPVYPISFSCSCGN